jgi:Flp pilus assembly pilin Flp
MKKVLRRSGQSTLEYVIVLTAIIAAILLAAAQFIKPSVNKVFCEVGSSMDASSGRFGTKIGHGVNFSSVVSDDGGD